MSEDFDTIGEAPEEIPGAPPEAAGEEKPPIGQRIQELEAQGLRREDIAYQLVQEHYKMKDIVKATHVNPRVIKKMKEGSAVEAAGAKKNADEAVIATAEAKALEEMKQWTGKEAHETLQELLALGRLMYGMGVRERAARRGMPLLDYVENALNFYDFWYNAVVELINLGVLSMDGFINGDAVCYEEVTPV
jgi:hypothetical protein